MNVNEHGLLIVNGEDRSGGMCAELRDKADAMRDDALELRIKREMDVLKLGSSVTGSEYLAQHTTLLRARNCVDTNAFSVNAGRGPAGRLMFVFRKFLWKLLRYQHDWMAFTQNQINVQTAYQLEFEIEERENQIARLEERIAKLEERNNETI